MGTPQKKPTVETKRWREGNQSIPLYKIISSQQIAVEEERDKGTTN